MSSRTWKMVFHKNVAGRQPIVIIEKFSTILGKDGNNITSADGVQAEDYAEEIAGVRGWDLVAVEEI